MLQVNKAAKENIVVVSAITGVSIFFMYYAFNIAPSHPKFREMPISDFLYMHDLGLSVLLGVVMGVGLTLIYRVFLGPKTFAVKLLATIAVLIVSISIPSLVIFLLGNNVYSTIGYTLFYGPNAMMFLMSTIAFSAIFPIALALNSQRSNGSGYDSAEKISLSSLKINRSWYKVKIFAASLFMVVLFFGLVEFLFGFDAEMRFWGNCFVGLLLLSAHSRE